MVSHLADFDSAFEACPLITILRGITPDKVVPIADALIGAGFTLIEVPLNSPDPFESIGRLVSHCAGRALVGAGTVMTAADARRLGEIGAGLMVTPTTDPEVVSAGAEAGLATVIGCMTATEAVTALRHGATALKIFPANVLAPGYARDLKAILPAQTRLLAVGGIDADNMSEFRRGGYDGFGLGSSLYAPGRTAEEVRKHAGTLRAAWERSTLG